MNSSPELVVDWCSYQAAKYAVEHWHYSKTMPAGRNNYLGIWEAGRFVGVVVFGYSISPQLGKQFGLKQREITELRRVAILEHKSPVSQIVAYSLARLKKKNPGLRLVISFADSAQGHMGTIYQAGNWIFVGGSHVEQRLINGRWRNDVHANRMGIRTTRMAPMKFKYLYPLDRAMRRQIAPLAKLYPKRGPGVQGDTPADQAGGPGSSPGVRL